MEQGEQTQLENHMGQWATNAKKNTRHTCASPSHLSPTPSPTPTPTHPTPSRLVDAAL